MNTQKNLFPMPQPSDFDNVEDYKKAMKEYQSVIDAAKKQQGMRFDVSKMQSIKNKKFMA